MSDILPTIEELTGNNISERDFKNGLDSIINYLNLPSNKPKGNQVFILDSPYSTLSHSHYITIDTDQIRYLIEGTSTTDSGISRNIDTDDILYLTVESENNLTGTDLGVHTHTVSIMYNHIDGKFFIANTNPCPVTNSVVVDHPHIFKQTPWIDGWEKIVVQPNNFSFIQSNIGTEYPAINTIREITTYDGLKLPIRVLQFNHNNFMEDNIPKSVSAYTTVPINPRWVQDDDTIHFYCAIIYSRGTPTVVQPGMNMKMEVDCYINSDVYSSSSYPIYSKLLPIGLGSDYIYEIKSDYIHDVTLPIESSTLTFKVARAIYDPNDRPENAHFYGLALYFKKRGINDSSMPPIYETPPPPPPPLQQ